MAVATVNYAAMKVPELKAELKKRGAVVGGVQWSVVRRQSSSHDWRSSTSSSMQIIRKGWS